MIISSALRSVAAHGPRSRLEVITAAEGIVRARRASSTGSPRCSSRRPALRVSIWSRDGLSRSRGFPDIVVLTMTGIIDRLHFTLWATDLPVIADTNPGYENALTWFRPLPRLRKLVRRPFTATQMAPKKCGHYSGMELISIGQTTKNFEAAQRGAILTW
jgi:2-methylisocitrate lyase-like PEP mutase family enzyme